MRADPRGNGVIPPPSPSSSGASPNGPHLPRVAIIGSGVAGLSAAHTLKGLAHVTLFEAGTTFGGHAHTVDITMPDRATGAPTTFGVDTGFLVLNERTYPHLLALFSELGVDIAPSDMSFSVQAAGQGHQGQALEWSGSDLNTVFSQRRNLLRPAFWRMLSDIVRFNRLATTLARQGADLSPLSPLRQPLREFLSQHRFSKEFIDWYLLPMLGCIWSCPTDQMLAFPVATLIRFCHNHGLIQVSGRPQWFTVKGGSRNYVDKIVASVDDARLNSPVRHLHRHGERVHVTTDRDTEAFDAAILACHTDQSLRILGQSASAEERSLLGAIRYQPNRAVLHTDESVLPRSKRAWAAWNYERSPQAQREQADVCLHYLINKLQPLPTDESVVVSLNPRRDIAPDKIIGEYEYDHPVFDLRAIEAQGHMSRIQGKGQVWFAGAWAGYGFHEDGLKSGLQAARCVIRKFEQAPAPAHSATEVAQ